MSKNKLKAFRKPMLWPMPFEKHTLHAAKQPLFDFQAKASSSGESCVFV
jgi:hypothetical protein